MKQKFMIMPNVVVKVFGNGMNFEYKERKPYFTDLDINDINQVIDACNDVHKHFKYYNYELGIDAFVCDREIYFEDNKFKKYYVTYWKPEKNRKDGKFRVGSIFVKDDCQNVIHETTHIKIRI